jgi:GntR family transcriptional regulator
MYYIHLNKFTTVPLYRQLYDAFTAAINQGLLNHNDLLPTEEMISMTFNISRPVVRQAYQLLIDDKKVVRHKGKGTYVAPRLKRSDVLEHFHTFVGRSNPAVSTHVLSLEKTDIPMEALRYFDAETSFYHLKRLHTHQNHPLILEDVYLPVPLFDQPDLSKATWPLTLMAAAHFPSHFDQDVMIAQADDSTAALLGIKSKSPVYRTGAVMMAQRQPILFVKAVFNGDDHHLEVTLP